MTSSTEFSPAIATRRGGTTDHVANALRQSIVTLELVPGAQLDKRVLTARFGVSRFPISEALNRLKREGLVDVRPQSGSRVSLIRLSDAEENLFMRRALEAEVAETLARRGDADLLAELKDNLRRQKIAVDTDDREGFHALDLALHDRMVEALAFPRLRAITESVRLSLDRVRRLLGSPRRHAVTYGEHVEIVAALEAGRPEDARAAMVAHIDAVLTELRIFCRKHPEVFADLTAPSADGRP
ncbi:GntR family transcriptional regulator [Chelativorans sp. M5D2P16]|uniref:GntR family transcriptional regulator n=1 Tax=Chelativorans sp. M5D2P16 TaxID=3095678 RepID=UPI002ACA821B|nr:GntR family transcriptional regulator [Chelativorans sp. M5D2P16]MDZ5698908.1 GntR family transcriptional regulator [Chelativorans sp. M5D2P16]